MSSLTLALDLGAGYVRIDATGISEDQALNIATDIIAWVRAMRGKYQCPIVEQFEDGSRVAEIPPGNAACA